MDVHAHCMMYSLFLATLMMLTPVPTLTMTYGCGGESMIRGTLYVIGSCVLVRVGICYGHVYVYVYLQVYVCTCMYVACLCIVWVYIRIP